MKREILTALQRAERLLIECGWDDRAAWFRVRRERLQSLPEASDELKNIAREIDGILVGRGSFSDVPMYPKSGSLLTRKQARAEQWALTDELHKVLDPILAISDDVH
jgi:hypothetical protein